MGGTVGTDTVYVRSSKVLRGAGCLCVEGAKVEVVSVVGWLERSEKRFQCILQPETFFVCAQFVRFLKKERFGQVSADKCDAALEEVDAGVCLAFLLSTGAVRTPWLARRTGGI